VKDFMHGFKAAVVTVRTEQWITIEQFSDYTHYVPNDSSFYIRTYALLYILSLQPETADK